MTKAQVDTSVSYLMTRKVECTNCKSKMYITKPLPAYSKEKGGRKKGIWWCDRCGSGYRPISFPADKETRWERRMCHNDMDCYMLITGISTSAMYKLVSLWMGIPLAYCHFGWFDLALCQRFRRELYDQH